MIKDIRHTIIGSRHRASSRYYALVNRLSNTYLPRNKCYIGVELHVDKEDFIQWFSKLDFYKSSVDRIDKTKHYTLSNMQVIPMIINNTKDRLIAKEGKTRCYVCKETKILEEFVVDKRVLSTGRSTLCKDCDRIRCRDKYLRSTGR